MMNHSCTLGSIYNSYNIRSGHSDSPRDSKRSNGKTRLDLFTVTNWIYFKQKTLVLGISSSRDIITSKHNHSLSLDSKSRCSEYGTHNHSLSRANMVFWLNICHIQTCTCIVMVHSNLPGALLLLTTVVYSNFR